jgi:hypothetical protein
MHSMIAKMMVAIELKWKDVDGNEDLVEPLMNCPDGEDSMKFLTGRSVGNRDDGEDSLEPLWRTNLEFDLMVRTRWNPWRTAGVAWK